jgi:hypothetical protein
MAQIYSRAHVTIVASNAADAADGFLERRNSVKRSNKRLPFRISPNQFGSVIADQSWLWLFAYRYDWRHNPLRQRAWALQEHMMANRMLLYTHKTLEWRCASGMMSLNNSLNLDSCHDPVPKLLSQLSTDPKAAASEWMWIVQDYSSRCMSIQSDKLPAIAALAEKFAPVLGEYYAGIWEYEHLLQLGWYLLYPSTRSFGDEYRAPSWSWASTNGIFFFRDDIAEKEEEEECSSIVSVEVVRKNEQVPYGEVVQASMSIRGKVAIGSIETRGKHSSRITLIEAEDEGIELPLREFYKIYFDQSVQCMDRGRAAGSYPRLSWDRGRAAGSYPRLSWDRGRPAGSYPRLSWDHEELHRSSLLVCELFPNSTAR